LHLSVPRQVLESVVQSVTEVPSHHGSLQGQAVTRLVALRHGPWQELSPQERWQPWDRQAVHHRSRQPWYRQTVHCGSRRLQTPVVLAAVVWQAPRCQPSGRLAVRCRGRWLETVAPRCQPLGRLAVHRCSRPRQTPVVLAAMVWQAPRRQPFGRLAVHRRGCPRDLSALVLLAAQAPCPRDPKRHPHKSNVEWLVPSCPRLVACSPRLWLPVWPRPAARRLRLQCA